KMRRKSPPSSARNTATGTRCREEGRTKAPCRLKAGGGEEAICCRVSFLCFAPGADSAEAVVAAVPFAGRSAYSGLPGYCERADGTCSLAAADHRSPKYACVEASYSFLSVRTRREERAKAVLERGTHAGVAAAFWFFTT